MSRQFSIAEMPVRSIETAIPSSTNTTGIDGHLLLNRCRILARLFPLRSPMTTQELRIPTNGRSLTSTRQRRPTNATRKCRLPARGTQPPRAADPDSEPPMIPPCASHDDSASAARLKIMRRLGSAHRLCVEYSFGVSNPAARQWFSGSSAMYMVLSTVL